MFICTFYEYFIFKYSYKNALALVETKKLDALLLNSWQQLAKLSEKDQVSVCELDKIIAPIILALTNLGELDESCKYSYSSQEATICLTKQYQAKLNNTYLQISQSGAKRLLGDV